MATPKVAVEVALSAPLVEGVCDAYRAAAVPWAGGLLPARPCRRCGGGLRVEMAVPSYEARLRAILAQRPRPAPSVPQQCPACHGTGALDALREVEIMRRRADRLADAAGILSEYAMGAAGEAEGPRGARCLRIVAHALRAHLQDWGADPECGRATDLAEEEG